MAHVILGLLLIRPQSLYDLLKTFEAGVSLFYSSSSGSIKRALDGLRAENLIEVVEAGAGSRGRKVYHVTDAGRAEFERWMTADPTGADIETAALPRLFLLGLLKPADRGSVVRRIIARIEADLAQLIALGERLSAVEVAAADRGIATHQLATLDYGISSHRHALAWFSEYLIRQESGPHGSELPR